MAVKKRQLEDSTSVPKSKKTKLATEGKKEKKVKPDQPTQHPVHTAPEEVDFPRGGGSSFTPLEVKTIRAEAVKEANDELFKVSSPCIFMYICANSLNPDRIRRI